MPKKKTTSKSGSILTKDPNILFSMSHAPKIDHEVHWFQMLPILLFTSLVILIVRLQEYTRPMQDFYWYQGPNDNVDFFSLYKSQLIIGLGIFVIALLLYRAFCQTLVIKKSAYYIPMGIYLFFVLLSYLFSDYKEFALMGWPERFEGTIVLFAYMILLFFIINTVNSEKHVKWVIGSAVLAAVLLGILGLTQYFGADFFQTQMGKMLITPPDYWGSLDKMDFKFLNGEIYQTVYNINYVSFYLTLLVPLLGILFLNEKQTKMKIAYGLIFALLVFNMIGSASSGGLLGLGVSFILALIFFRKKMIEWKKPIAIVLGVVLVVGIATFSRFTPELINAAKGVMGKTQAQSTAAELPVHLDYIDTQTNGVVMSIDNETLIMMSDDISNPGTSGISFVDEKDNPIALLPTTDDTGFALDDPRFSMCKLQPATDGAGRYFAVLTIAEKPWFFEIAPTGVTYYNDIGKNVDLDIIPSVGFENNQYFGSGRGYIWSRSLPMLKDTLFIGHGADTYTATFPNKDYVGKYNSGVFTDTYNIVIDKPHNMYLGTAINTGVISLLAQLAIFALYILQSVKLYRKNDFSQFLPLAGVGIFISVCGFLASALVNDSTVSVMPMFYGLLGTGIAINMILEQRKKENEIV